VRRLLGPEKDFITELLLTGQVLLVLTGLQEPAAACLQCLPQLLTAAGPTAGVYKLAKKIKNSSAAVEKGAEANSWEASSSGGKLPSELLAASQLMQRELVHIVVVDTELSKLAQSAFRCVTPPGAVWQEHDRKGQAAVGCWLMQISQHDDALHQVFFP